MTNIIFLDFYGVMDGPEDTAEPSGRLSKKCGKLINDFCKEMDARIVVISDSVIAANHYIEKVGWIIEDLTKCGVEEKYIKGFTYQTRDSLALSDRPNEIREWIDNAPDEINYVIFDDKPLKFTKQDIIDFTKKGSRLKDHWLSKFKKDDPESKKRFIQVDMIKGLTKEDIDKAREILNG